MTHIKALKLARDCIRDSVEYKQGKATAIEAVEDIDEALAQPQQEPVAIALNTGTKQGVKWLKSVEHGESLYTSPPQRKPLSLDELEALWNSQADHMNQWDELGLDEIVAFAQAAHGIKENT